MATYSGTARECLLAAREGMADNGMMLCFFDCSDLGYLAALVFRRTANWCSAWCTGYQYAYGYLLRWSGGKDYSATKMTGTAM